MWIVCSRSIILLVRFVYHPYSSLWLYSVLQVVGCGEKSVGHGSWVSLWHNHTHLGKPTVTIVYLFPNLLHCYDKVITHCGFRLLGSLFLMAAFWDGF